MPVGSHRKDCRLRHVHGTVQARLAFMLQDEGNFFSVAVLVGEWLVPNEKGRIRLRYPPVGHADTTARTRATSTRPSASRPTITWAAP